MSVGWKRGCQAATSNENMDVGVDPSRMPRWVALCLGETVRF